MSEHHPAAAAPTDVIHDRSRAFVAFALGLVGAMGGGALATGFQWLFLVAVDGDYFENLLGLIPLAFGAATFWLANGVRSVDPVAVPVARAAQVLGAVAVVGGALLLLAGLTGDF